ncbi:uncharacterized protein LOC117315726 [Pecten maximus]|uniref:uncharacterized protein LOC117315726 n=1 Tax=Pecten maximus TaxID=6579 RepID=UPI001458DD84|nr:uncharacterized protein LOC117315726 [Pecten maximus]
MAMLVKYGVSLGKLGLLGGAVGVTTHYGVWGNTEQGVNAYEQLQDLVEPYTPEELSQVKSMTTSAFNSRLESSPRSSGASKNSPSTFTEVYNKGVQKTFEFMVNSPGMVSGSMNNLTNTVKEQFKEK